MVFLVGSGTGPEVLAPVRRAVRTISDADWSSVAWSYDFSLMRIFCSIVRLPSLRGDRADDASAHGAATLANREAQPVFHRDRRDQLHLDRVHVVARHHHLAPRRQARHPGHVRGPKV